MWRAWRSTAALVAVGCGALATPAAAAPTIDAKQIVVRGEGATAIIQRSPFRISYADAGGRVVLQQAPADLPVAQPGQPAVDPEPLGTNLVNEREVYAPLTFEIGGEREVQYPVLLYAGNQLTGAKAGVIHHATQVMKAEALGEGVKLELATTDPTRILLVEVTPDVANAIRVTAKPSQEAGVSGMGEAFTSGVDEAFHGFGGRHNANDQRGNTFFNWIEQEQSGTGAFEPISSQFPTGGGERYHFPGGPTAAYYVQNLFVSSRPYGFQLSQPELTRWRMASDRPDLWKVAVAAPRLDYSVAVGPGPKAVGALTEINGRHRLPPEYAQGPNLKRGVFIGGQTVASYRAQIENDLKRIAELKLPVDNYSYEGFIAFIKEPAFIRSVNDRLRKMGIRPWGYLRAFIANDGDFFDNQELYDEAISNGYVAKTPTGQPYIYVSSAPAAVIDFTNPAAIKWWERRVRQMLDLGFDAFMQDFGEQVVADMRFFNGKTGAEMHNEYPTIYHRVTRDIVDRYQREHPERGEIFFYTRAGFSGRPGSAKFENANFPGDETSDYSPAFGLPSLANDMLNRAIGGAYGYTTDIGGYFDGPANAKQVLDKELFIRWSEWAALSPFFRVHNSCCTQGTRMPYSFDAEAIELWRKQAQLHVQAQPLVRKLWREALNTGVPMTRPLWLAFPGDKQAAKQEQEWMLGEDVLVAPVVAKGVKARKVYFPAGCWEHGETGERFAGEAEREVSAPLGQLPYFKRCGTQPFAAGSVAGLPSARRCISRRNFRIRLRAPRGQRLRSAVVRVNGKRVSVVRGKRLRAPVNLRGLQRGTFKVRIEAVTRSGRKLSSTRTYRTCVPRKQSKRTRS